MGKFGKIGIFVSFNPHEMASTTGRVFKKNFILKFKVNGRWQNYKAQMANLPLR